MRSNALSLHQPDIQGLRVTKHDLYTCDRAFSFVTTRRSCVASSWACTSSTYWRVKVPPLARGTLFSSTSSLFHLGRRAHRLPRYFTSNRPLLTVRYLLAPLVPTFPKVYGSCPSIVRSMHFIIALSTNRHSSGVCCIGMSIRKLAIGGAMKMMHLWRRRKLIFLFIILFVNLRRFVVVILPGFVSIWNRRATKRISW